MADEVELTDQELEAAAAAADAESGNETPAPAAETSTEGGDAPTTGETGKGAKTLAEALEEGITEGSKSRKVTPKAEAQAEADDARNDERNPDGTFKKKTEETPEQKAAREAEEAKAGKKEDPVNDPIDPKLSERTQTRIKSLVATVKEQQQLVETHTALFDAIQSTGASPEEFATMVNYMKAVRGNDPSALESAYKVLQQELVGLAVRMGKPLYEVNLLRNPENADLVKEINEGKLTPNRAHEISIQREAVKRGAQTQQRQVQAQQTQQRTQQEYEQARTTAKTELDALDKLLRTRDGDDVFQAKYDILVPQLEAVFPDIDPKLWKETFRKAYEKLPEKAFKHLVAAPALKPAPQGQQRQQPLRPKTPSGGGGGNVAAAPKSALEAINQAIDGMG